MTKLLVERAQRASACLGPAGLGRIEGVICEEAIAQGWTKPPVILWLADPFGAFAYLNRIGLDALLQMGTARLWRRARPQMLVDDDRFKFSGRPWELDRGFSSVGRA